MTSSSTILFVCEHGAAKSILAATYFNKLAEEKGLQAHALARGTNPDPDLSPKTVTGLFADGLAPSEPRPVRISDEDLQHVSLIVTFCDLPAQFHSDIKVEDWSDVPAVSEDYTRARDVILARLQTLIEQAG